MTKPECFSSEDDCEGTERKIKIVPRLKGRDRVITDDGVKSFKRYAKDFHTEEATEDVHDVRSTYLEELNRDKKMSIREKLMAQTIGHQCRPLVDKKERFEQSGFVKYLTKEDLELENLQRIREENWKEYGSMIDDNIIDLIVDYLKLKAKGEKSPMKMTHLLECALLALTKGPADLKGLVKRLDTALEQSQKKINFRFSDILPNFTETLRRIVKADPQKQWLRKYLIVDGNGTFATSKYEFPPPMMKVAAQYPSHMKEGWLKKLPKGAVPFTEEQLLKELPILSEMVVVDEPHHGGGTVSTESKDKSVYDIPTRKHDNEGNRRKLIKEMREMWMTVDDITKLQLYVGLMAASDKIVDLNKGWMKECATFISTHKNNRTYKKVTSGEISGCNRKLREGKLAICKLVLKDEQKKTSSVGEMGLIPDAASIPFQHLRKMCTSRSATDIQDGHSLLESHCQQNEWIDKHVHPDKYKEKPEEVKTVELDTDGLEGLEVIDETDVKTEVPEAFDVRPAKDRDIDPMLKLANAMSDIAENGLSINFNIGFGTTRKEGSLSNLTEEVQATNEGLAIAIERMGLVMNSIQELTETLKSK